MRRGPAAFALLCLTCVLASASYALFRHADAPSEADAGSRASALRAYRAGLDHHLALDYDAAYRAYRDALVIDPEFLAPFFQMYQMHGETVPEFWLQFLDSLAQRQRDPDRRACIQAIRSNLRGRFALQASDASPSTDVQACREFARRSSYLTPGSTAETLSFLAAYRAVPAVGMMLIGMTADNGRWADALQLMAELQRSDQHPLTRAAAYAVEAMGRHRRGDERGARAAEDRARADPAWSLGGFRVTFYGVTTGHENMLRVSDRATPDSLVAHERAMLEESIAGWVSAAREGDDIAHVVEGSRAAGWLLDRGRLTDAVAEWTALNDAARRVGDVSMLARTNMKLGRALVKTGRLADAERHLLTSRALQAAGTATTHKETEHNLLHLYETLGRDDEAQRAGESFVRFANMAGLHAVRMMSARDFARFLRSRGKLDESRRYFALMLADVDSLSDGAHWSGEYYELSGDLDKAREYYMRALQSFGADVIRVQEALARISLAAGDSLGAIRFARLHDQRRTSSGLPESAPILPGILRRVGRPNEARVQLEAARALFETSSQVAAQAALTLELAELELSQGNWRRSRVLADSAAAAAHGVGATDIHVRASTVAALAALHARENAIAAARALDRAVRDADRLAHAELRAEVRRRRAEGVALSGRWRDALPYYAEAAVVSDSVAAGIALDPQQAGFRAAQRVVYDGALQTIVAHAGERDAAQHFADWSRWRKGRGYTPGARTNGSGGVPNVSAGRALIDYVVLDSVVAALVVTSSRTTLTVLPIQADTLRQLVRRLHTALAVRVGSTIDLSRASFPLALAHQLYQRLVAPLEGLLAGARELTIVPDGPLFLVPFDALVSELPPLGSKQPDVEARYLLDRYIVTQSVSLEGNSATLAPSKGGIVTVAPVLDGPLGAESGREVAAIGRIVPAIDYATLRGSHATERAVREAAARSAVLHFAAHATANHHDPASSRVALAKGDGDDGALYPDEIAQLQLHGSLVVLSACETAAGRVLDGEGVLSLSRSFLRAGASATIATLWPVGPRSADFMAAFYAPLLEGDSPAAALRAAKLTMRKAGVPPFFWAPYTLIARLAA